MTPQSVIQEPAIWLVLAWFVRELYSYLKDKGNKHTQALVDNTLEIHKLSLVLVEFKVEIQNLKEATKHIPKMQQDLNILHDRVRRIAPEYSRQD
jgi:hypothetical protein